MFVLTYRIVLKKWIIPVVEGNIVNGHSSVKAVKLRCVKTRDYRSLLYTARFNIFVLSLLTLYIYKTCYTFQEQNEPMYFSKNEFTAFCFFTYLADNAILFVFSC